MKSDITLQSQINLQSALWHVVSLWKDMCDITENVTFQSDMTFHSDVTGKWYDTCDIIGVMRDMTHPHVWHDPFLCVRLFILMREIVHSYAWHDSFLCVRWLIHMCDMTQSYVWHDSCWYDLIQNESCHITHVNESCHWFGMSPDSEWFMEWVMSHIWMSHVTHHITHMNEACHWLRMSHGMSHVTIDSFWISDMTHLCVWYDVWHDSFICVTRLIPVNMTWFRCTLQHTATLCNTLQHTDILYVWHFLFLSIWPDSDVLCNTLQHSATHCNTLIYSMCDISCSCQYDPI